MTAIVDQALPGVTPLTDWIASDGREPPAGRLAYECKVGNHHVLCDRQDDLGQVVWTTEDSVVPKSMMTAWRVIIVPMDHHL